MNRAQTLAHRRAERCTSEIAGMTARSRALLDAIDETLAALDGNAESLRFMASQANSLLASLAECEPTRMLDPERTSVSGLRESAKRLADNYALFTKKRESAVLDQQLTHEDGVVEAYDAYLAAVHEGYDALEAVCDALETLDAMHSPADGEATADVDQLFSDMGL